MASMAYIWAYMGLYMGPELQMTNDLRLRETCPEDHPARDWDIQYGIFMPKLQGDDEDIELEGIPPENNHLIRKYGATSVDDRYSEIN
eukprot:1182145-Prorocentrum_minimum.AAC.3